MSCHRVTRLVFTTLSGAALWCGIASHAIAGQPDPQQPPGAPPPGDPSARVARLSFISGSTSFRPAELDEWTNATLNYPLTNGDHLWTDRDGRAEIDLGTVVIRVAPLTEFSILTLDDRMAQVRVTEGSVTVRVRERADDEDLEIDTPNGAADLLAPGNYRVDVNENGDASTFTVRHGESEVTSAQETHPVQEAQAFFVTGTTAPTSRFGAAVPIDEFEDWSLARDRRADNAPAVQYVSRGTIGYSDLDNYGTWRTDPDYGAVWMPRVDAEWVPYRNGHWAWISPWGWTWIDDAPWGFAPFHYGRWAYMSSGGWGWVPGRVVARPVYAPALVAFVGGSNWNVAVTAGAAPVGWFPLGPREPFVPAYRVSPTYVRAINVSHVTVTNVNVTNITYVNRNAPRAVTVVSRETFVQARPVASAVVAVPREQIRAAVVIGTTAPIQAQRVSIIGRIATVRVATPPAVVVNRQVVVRRMPPPGAAGPAVARAPAAPGYVRTPAPARVPIDPRARAPMRPADLAARQTRERADFAARQQSERVQLSARHQHDEAAVANGHQRAQLQQQHQHEMQALQDRQKAERDNLQRRQASERQQHQGENQREQREKERRP